VADEIIATGRVTHAFIGIQAEPLSASATRETGGAQGLRVVTVVPGGPAASAGLREGDIITSIDGKSAVSTDQLITVTLTKRAGDRVEIGYSRDGSKATVTLTLTARPEGS
jgi:putative serine protease PepD